MLSRSYPWPTVKCSDLECFPCSTGHKHLFSCRIPGVGYQIVCTICEQLGSSAVYYGETGQNLYTRGGQHLREFNRKLSTNSMVIHNNLHHRDHTGDFNFRMEGMALFSSPLTRQINESLRIKYSEAEAVMNSGSEWRMDPIPRARVERIGRPGHPHQSS